MSESNRERVTLRELIEQRFQSMETALELSAKVMEARLERLNELRETLESYMKESVTRPECGILHKKLDEDVRMLRESKAMLEGKASQLSVNITMALAIIGIVVSIIAMLHK